MALFPENGIISLLDQRVPHNLAESTSLDLSMRELLADDALLERLRSVSLEYGTSRGHAELRAAIAGEAGVAADDVLITAGAAAALFLCTFTICNAGDEIVTTTPQFPPTIDTMKAIGCPPRMVRLHFDRGYRLELDAFRAALSPRTRLVVVATPGNPSGVIIPPGVLRELAALMAATCPEAYLLVDETYREAVYGSDTAPAPAADVSPRTLVLSSMSKALGAPGLRIGWLVCRDRALMDALLRAKMNMFISCSVLDELLALEVLRRKAGILAQRRAMLATARTRVAHWIETHTRLVEWVQPDAGAMCCVRLRPEVFDDGRVARFHAMLPDRGVMVGRGVWFAEEDRVFRLGFGYLPLDRLGPALAALAEALHAAAP